MGACPGGGNTEAYFDEEGTVDMATINRFKAEKFKLVGKRKFKANDMLTDADSTIEKKGNGNGNGNGGGNGNGNGRNKVKMTRLSNDMFEYSAAIDEDEIPNFPDTVPDVLGTEPVGEIPDEEGDEENRKLYIFGSDTRYEMDSYGLATYWPQRLNGRTAIGCSGTIISKDAVLTAGHCVYSNGAWRDGDFTPAQFRNYQDGQVKKPYGTYDWRYMTTYSAWTQNGDFNYDIAVVRYWPRNGQDIGDRLGYAGLRRTSSSSSYLHSTYNTGYPSDKGNHEMWKSYCGDVFRHGTNPYVVDHTCDITYGNSGGSFIDWDGYVHAVQSYHYTTGGVPAGNGAVLMNGIHYDNVLSWSGRT